MMMRKKEISKLESSASVVDGNLILSLPDAINPVVWRMELGSVKASALEVRPHAEGSYMLVLKTPKGELHEIAPFGSKDLAVTALMRVSAALQSADGKIAPMQAANVVSMNGQAAAPATPIFHKPDAGAVKWLLALAGVLAVIFLFAFLAKSSPQLDPSNVNAPVEDNATSTTTGSPNPESGVPQSADDALKGF